MDGVLVDSEPVDQEAWTAILVTHGITAVESDFLSLIGRPTKSVFEYFEMKFAVKLDNCVLEEKRKLFYSIAKSRLKAMPKVEECIRTLRDAGFLLAVASSSDLERIRFSLSHVGLNGYFHTFCSGEEVSRPKPAPDVFLLAARKLGVPPETCAVVEDSLYGLRASIAANMTGYGYTSSFPEDVLRENGATGVFSDFDELKSYLV